VRLVFKRDYSPPLVPISTLQLCHLPRPTDRSPPGSRPQIELLPPTALLARVCCSSLRPRCLLACAAPPSARQVLHSCAVFCASRLGFLPGATPADRQGHLLMVADLAAASGASVRDAAVGMARRRRRGPGGV
jgi:hypothetical protein